MSEEAAFPCALLADPRDRALHLVYADFLEERGDRESVLLAQRLRQECRHRGFPHYPVNGVESRVFCPAFAQVIDDGLCWECCMADQGGPTSTAEQLRCWVAESGRIASVRTFQEVCASCPNCAWRPATPAQRVGKV
jgi:uncharacterized protein (TIGR02996 family)